MQCLLLRLDVFFPKSLLIYIAETDKPKVILCLISHDNMYSLLGNSPSASPIINTNVPLCHVHIMLKHLVSDDPAANLTMSLVFHPLILGHGITTTHHALPSIPLSF